MTLFLETTTDFPASGQQRTGEWSAVRSTAAAVALAVALGCWTMPGEAASLKQSILAFDRGNYKLALSAFSVLAARGNPAAQSYLGYMYETGRGVPLNHTEAAFWYRRAAEQGETAAQYSLGLLYDRGFGVPRNIVEANKWLNLSAAGAPPQARASRARIRDAVATKMTRGEIAESRLRAIEWVPTPE